MHLFSTKPVKHQRIHDDASDIPCKLSRYSFKSDLECSTSSVSESVFTQISCRRVVEIMAGSALQMNFANDKPLKSHLKCVLDKILIGNTNYDISMQFFLAILYDLDFAEYMLSQLYSTNNDISDNLYKLNEISTAISILFPDNVYFFYFFLKDFLFNCSANERSLIIAYVFVLLHSSKWRNIVNSAVIVGFSKELDTIINMLRSICISCADLLLIMRNTDNPEKIFHSAWIESEIYMDSILKRLHLYNEIFPCDNLYYLPFFVCLNFNIFWWQNADISDNRSYLSTISTKELQHFFVKVVSPYHLKLLFFKKQHDFSFDALFPASIRQKFFEDKLLFGEEFEYLVFQKTQLADDFSINFKLMKNAIYQWMDRIQVICPTVQFIETSENISINDPLIKKFMSKWKNDIDKEIELIEYISIVAIIDTWQVKIKTELCFEHGLVVEFNASPYGINQQFQVGERSFSAYEMLQKFVIEPAKSMGWIEYSGHKHVDIANAVGNNIELLFRLLVDIENRSWLSVITRQDSKDYFPYFSQKQDFNQLAFSSALAMFNGLIGKNYKNKQGNAFISISMIEMWKQLFNEHIFERGPGFINCSSVTTLDEVKQSKICDPSSTLEFRFFNCARNEREIQLINQLLVAWMKHISLQQKLASPIDYVPINPEDISYEEAIEKFKNFIEILGLDWTDYRKMLWLEKPYYCK